MFQSFRHHLLSKLVALFAVLSLSSCDVDIWSDISVIEGSWRIVEIESYRGQCPYYWNDYVEFRPDGNFSVWGSGYSDYGYWDYYDGAIRVDFNYDGWDDWVAYVRQLDDAYVVLDVNDYDYNSQYTLRMVRY